MSTITPTRPEAKPETRNGQPGLLIDDQLWLSNDWIFETARQLRYSQNDIAYERAQPVKAPAEEGIEA